MDKLIPISIVGAKITSFTIEFDSEGLPEFNASVGLIDSQGKQLTSIYITSKPYYSNGQCEKSIAFMELTGKIRKELDVLVTRHINAQQKTLEVKE